MTERPLRADARRNYDRLLAAARDAFAEHGTEATLDDIAKRAVLGPGTLYRHFPSREALLAAVYEGEMRELAARSDELAGRLPPRDALEAWLRLQLDYVKTKRGLGVAVKSMLGTDSTTLAVCRGLMRGALDRLLSRAQEAGVVRTDVATTDLLRLVHAVAMASESDPENADHLLTVIFDGLRPPPGA